VNAKRKAADPLKYEGLRYPLGTLRHQRPFEWRP
jgi:hypothetical protein